MAGSLQRFIYDLDPNGAQPGGEIILKLDESNQRAIGNPPTSSFGTITPPSTRVTRVEPRYIYWEGQTSGGKVVRRRIVVTTVNNSFYQTGGQLTLPVQVANSVEQVAGNITGSIGEKKQFGTFANVDTGQDDGTNP